jgi:hypothetical protein
MYLITKLRSAMLQERINILMLLTTEQELIIHLNPEDIIDDFII